MACTPVPYAVPGQLDHDHHQAEGLGHHHPYHAVTVTGAHLLVVQVEQITVTVRAGHVLSVHDQAAVLLQELLDSLDVLAVAGPGVPSKEVVTLLVDAGLAQHWLQGRSVKLEQLII